LTVPAQNFSFALFLRVFAVSLLIAMLAVSPDIAEVKNWDMPGWLHKIVFLPHVCLGYMEVFFHELGHTATFWLYGQPAVPQFNFADGGGFSRPLMARSLPVQAGVYAALAYAAFRFFSNGEYLLLAALCLAMPVQIGFAFGQHYMLPVNFMGHGGSVLVGCFCLYRAAVNRAPEMRAAGERYAHMAFGLFTLLHNMVMSWSLMTSDIARDVYNQGIGGHIANDYTVIADRLDTDLQHVACFGMAYTLLCLAVTAWLAWAALQNEAPVEAEMKATRRIKRRN
jgi:hypothetical protein